MQLVCEMPTIHFKPAELKKKTGMCGLFVKYLLQLKVFWIVRASKFNDRVVFSVWKSTSKAITLLNLFESYTTLLNLYIPNSNDSQDEVSTRVPATTTLIEREQQSEPPLWSAWI